MMHILLVCGSLGGGGAERVAVNISETLTTQGHLVTLYYWNDKKLQTYDLNQKVRLVKSRRSNFTSRLLGLRKEIRSNTPDVVVGFTDVANIVCYGALHGLRKRPSFIATIHSDLKFRDKHIKNSLKFKLIRQLHRKACLFSEKVITVSDGAKESLIDYYRLPPSLVERIYNPILNRVSVSVKKRSVHAPYKLVAAGRLTRAKNYPHLIKAVKVLVEDKGMLCTLDIYGEGELRQELQDLIDKLGLGEIIRLQGFAENLPDRLKDYDIFIMSSSWEGLPTVLIEALNADLRVISTDCPSGPSEILAKGKYGELVPVDNVEQLALAIINSANGKPSSQSHELYAHLNSFTNEESSKKYISLIEKVARRA